MTPILQSAALVIALSLTVVGNARAQDQVKAAFLQHFAQFVEWPAALLPPKAPIVIGLIGDDRLDGAIAGKHANGHALVIRHMRWNEPLSGCQMIFVSSSEQQHIGAILDAARGFSILTVGDGDRFTERGGMIELMTVQNRVRFDVNPDAAAAAHLRISSRLLHVARAIRGTLEGR